MPRVITSTTRKEVVEYIFTESEVEDILKREVAKDFAFQRAEMDADVSQNCLHNITIVAWSTDEMEE